MSPSQLQSASSMRAAMLSSLDAVLENAERTLTDNEVNTATEKLRQKLADGLKVTLR